MRQTIQFVMRWNKQKIEQKGNAIEIVVRKHN